MTVIIGSDHGGFALKCRIVEYLTEKNITVEDCGTYTVGAVDYPQIAFVVCDRVLAETSKGILVCGTGIGVSICANKVKGIRAALCHSEFDAQMARGHNDANVLCLGERTTAEDTALVIVETFLNGTAEGDRHERRVNMITEYEGRSI